MEYYSPPGKLFEAAKSLTMETSQNDVCRLTGEIAQSRLFFGGDEGAALNKLYKLIAAFLESLINKRTDSKSKLEQLTDFASKQSEKY